MMLLAFSVFDSKAEVFSKPFFEGTKGSAIRAFSDAVNEEGHTFHKHAEDYTLFHVGAYDDSMGVFVEHSAPSSLGNALVFVTDRFRDVAMAGGVPGLVSPDQLED